MMNDVPYEGWDDCGDNYGRHVGSENPVTIRVGIYQPNDDPDGFSIALCTSGGQPILLDEQAARALSDLLTHTADDYHRDLQRQQQWRQAAARDLIDAAVLGRDQRNQLRAALTAGDNAADREDLVDLLTACAPARWVTGTPAASEE